MSPITRLFIVASASVFVSTCLFTLSDAEEVSRFGRSLLESKPTNKDDILGGGAEVFKEDLPSAQTGETKTLHVTRTLLSVETEPNTEERNMETNDDGTTDKNAASHAINDERDDAAGDEERDIATSARYGGSSDSSGYSSSSDHGGYWY